MPEALLPFENTICELQELADKASSPEDRERYLALAVQERTRVYSNLTPWERVQLARHPKRPRMLDYTTRILDDFIELHGDRAIGDDPAMVCGIGSFHGQTVFITGHQKGVTTEEKVCRNFGMAHPEGFRKAMRLMETAERFNKPVLCFIDSAGAYPGLGAEERGQAEASASFAR